jgi:hypothetical protein
LWKTPPQTRPALPSYDQHGREIPPPIRSHSKMPAA